MDKGLILVGAGPGDPELITLKGIKAIVRADVILYDALACKQLLNYAKKSAKIIFVGKRAGTHSMAQSAINCLIQKYAVDHLVVRLKGGDPFVFGRGYEEIEVTQKNNIPYKIIPGISSAVSAAACTCIPITHRNLSRSFWVVTGTNANGELNKDIELACQSTATLVVLMGTRKLRQIAELIKMHRGCLEPMAVIQNATTPHQLSIFGNATNISSKYEAMAIEGPGIIIIGKVVEFGISQSVLFMAQNASKTEETRIA